MKKAILIVAIIWAALSAGVPALESWELGSIATMGSDQIERIEE